MRARTRLWGALLAVSTLVVVTACTDDAPSQGAATSAAAGDGKEVVLVTYDAFALPEAAAAAFTDRTGAKIKVVASGDAGAMLSKALLSAGAPEGDVLFGVDNTLATRVTDEDLLSPYTPPGTTDVPDPLKLSGKPGRLLTPIDSGDVCINVDATWFAQHGLAPPTTLDDLTDPRYRDLLVVQSPVTSSPGLAFLIGTVQRYGADGWKDYWTRLQANGVLVRPSWDDSYSTDYTVSGGDRPLVVSYASSPPAEVVFSEGAVTQPRSTVMADSCVAQVEYAGVLNGAAHPTLARELVDFMLSPAWQSALPLSNFVFPAVDGTPLPPEFQQWAVKPAAPRTLSATEIGSKREAWIEQWRDIME
jgi:thiamine transport system substrate-binding protein